MDYPPYWSFPGKCANQAFDVAATTKCMTGRTFYVLGSSVARQAAFKMVEMLGGNPTHREGQKQQCPKASTAWGDSCHSDIGGVKIKYAYLQWIDKFYYSEGFPYFRIMGTDGQWSTGKFASDGKNFYNNPEPGDFDHKITKPDLCLDSGDIRKCLEVFFQDATENDVLVTTVGMSYIVRAPGDEPATSPGIDYAQWFQDSAAQFKGHIDATFKGRVFVTSLPEYRDGTPFAQLSPMSLRINDILWNNFKPTPEQERPWYFVDQWPINHGRHEHYDDHVHFNGILTVATVQQVLNELCTGAGNNVIAPAALTDPLKQLRSGVVVKVELQSGTDYVLVVEGIKHRIPDQATFEGLEVGADRLIVSTKEVVALFPDGPAIDPCSMTANNCKDSKFYQILHN